MNILHTILDLEERMFTEDLFQELRTAYEQEPVKNTSELTDSELLDAYRDLQAELEPSQMTELQNLERLSEEYEKMVVPTAFRQGQFTGFQQYFVENTSKTPYTDFTEHRKTRAPYAMSMRETFAADRFKEVYEKLHNDLPEHLQTHLQKIAIGWEDRIDWVMRHSFFLGYYFAHKTIELTERKGASTMQIIEKKLLTEYDLKLLQLREYSE